MIVCNRRILNEQDLVDVAASLGFELEILRFETLSFPEQVEK